MAYDSWGSTERYAYGQGIKKGRQLERDDKEFDIMCDTKQSKIDQIITALKHMGDTLDRIEARQTQAAERNRGSIITTTVVDSDVIDKEVAKRLREIAKTLAPK